MSAAPPLARADWSEDGTARCDWPNRLSIAPGGGGPSGSHSLPLRERVPKLSWAGRVRGLDGRRDGTAGPRGRPQPSAGPGAMPPRVPCPRHSPLGTLQPRGVTQCHPAPAACHPAAVPPPLHGCPWGAPCPASPSCSPRPRGSARDTAQGTGAAAGSRPGTEPSGEGLPEPGGGER